MTFAPRPPALLLVAHGSRDPRHAQVVRALARRVRDRRPGLRVAAGFLDHCGPALPGVLDRLASDGVTEVVAAPLLLGRAYHATTDVPEVLAAAAARHPGTAIRQADVLGPSPLLVEALERRLAEAGLPTDRSSVGVVLAAAGSSDPAARAAVTALARDWRSGGWAATTTAFASAAPPATEDAVRALRARGVRYVAVAPYLLAPGRLPDRIAAGARAAGADLVAGVLGPAPEIARLLLRRYDACAAPAVPARRSA